MAGIVLSAVELNSHLNHHNCNRNEENEPTICETAIEINDNTKNCNQHHNNINNNNNNSNDKYSKRSIELNGSISTISIVTLDDDDESSVVESDSDIEDVINHNERDKRSTSGIVLVNKTLDPPNCQSSILCTNNDIKPNIGSIAVQNSTDITFGNKTFYQGPVTIKQFVYDKNKWKENEQPENDNHGYISSNTDKLSRMQNGFTDTKDQPELQNKWECTNKQTLFSIILAGVLVCSLLALILFVKYTSVDNENRSSSNGKIGDSDDSRLNVPIDSSIGSDIITDTAGPLRIITRSEWIAQPPEHDIAPLELPSTRVIIAHTATENCTTQASCTYQVRLIQTFHIESRGFDDIAYNFLVGGDGAVYVGRGWDTQGAHTKGYNVKSICIAFIGTFNKIIPPKRQLNAAQQMIEEGVKLKKLTEDYALYGHRQLIASESPGLALYGIIKHWTHWNEEIK